MVWRLDDPCGDEAGKIKYEITQYTRGIGLDLGCGPKKAYPHFIGVDSCKDTELFGIAIRPDLKVEDCSDLSPYIEEASCDFVFSSHLLEHIEDYKAALKSWWSVIKVGGHLVLYLPHRRFYPNIGKHGANPDHKHDFLPKDIREAMRDVGGWDLVEDQDRNDGMEYSFYQVYRKRDDTAHVIKHRPTHKKTVCVVRFGGFGDMMQACNIFPELKAQGYRLTVMTTDRGKEVINLDPHVDEWFILDQDQVPNHELSEFWRVQAGKFDRFINLSESVEGSMLAMPGRANHLWPQAVRHKYMNLNYLEWTAELAELPFSAKARFYPSEEEKAAAKGDGFRILFVLGGSSVHKFYPHQDAVIARIMLEMPEAQVILSGDISCKLLESGWESEPRVKMTSGEIGIRETLALAQAVQCVVGPETGVLNAVAFEPNRKVCLLSHSSVENLTKHWANTASMEPEGQHCYPCHRLHYGTDYCETDKESGAAMCQMKIDPARVFDAIKVEYDDWLLCQRKAETP